LIVRAAHEIALLQPAMRSGEVGDINLNMMVVEGRQILLGFPEDEILLLADLHRDRRAVAVRKLRRRTDHAAIEGADPLCRSDRHVELDIGNAEPDAAEACGIRLVHAHAIAPRAGRLDEVVVGLKPEFCIGEFLLDRREPLQQRLPSLHHDAGDAAQHLRLAARQVELAAPDIDPHVGVGHHQVGIAREPEAGNVEQGGEPLVGDGDVDVLEMDDVADVLSGAIEVMLLHGRPFLNVVQFRDFL
jgi:hypothetical protein